MVRGPLQSQQPGTRVFHQDLIFLRDGFQTGALPKTTDRNGARLSGFSEMAEWHGEGGIHQGTQAFGLCGWRTSRLPSFSTAGRRPEFFHSCSTNCRRRLTRILTRFARYRFEGFDQGLAHAAFAQQRGHWCADGRGHAWTGMPAGTQLAAGCLEGSPSTSASASLISRWVMRTSQRP